MTDYEVLGRSHDLLIEDVAHVLLPGRGRDPSGYDLSEQSRERTIFTAGFYTEQRLADIGGIIVASGYKTPSDSNGDLWSPEDSPDEHFLGRPEADSMRLLLIQHGVGHAAIHVERHSIDSVTNFVNSENQGHFPDNRPTAIIAQREHLNRMVKLIAPKTLRREFLGIVVPEDGEPDHDSFFAALESRAVLLGIQPTTPDIVEKTYRRANHIWDGVNWIHAQQVRLKQALSR
jgi:hypothetical protein